LVSKPTPEPQSTRPPESGSPAARPRSSREETTERILDAADDLFAVRSPHDVTVRDVAAKAGVTHALVHQYVGTKDDLLHAVIQRAASNRVEIVRQSPSLRDAAEALAHDIVSNRIHSKALVRSAMDGVEYVPFAERIATAQALLQLAEETVAAGTLPAAPPTGVHPNVAMAAMTAMLFGWAAAEDWLWPLFNIDPAAKEAVYDQLADIASYMSDLALYATSDEPAVGSAD
jgi:AcrR family transcriptional regulator